MDDTQTIINMESDNWEKNWILVQTDDGKEWKPAALLIFPLTYYEK